MLFWVTSTYAHVWWYDKCDWLVVCIRARRWLCFYTSSVQLHMRTCCQFVIAADLPFKVEIRWKQQQSHVCGDVSGVVIFIVVTLNFDLFAAVRFAKRSSTLSWRKHWRKVMASIWRTRTMSSLRTLGTRRSDEYVSMVLIGWERASRDKTL